MTLTPKDIPGNIQRAEGYCELQRRGEELRKRVDQVGFHSATTLVVLGQKP